ncbi:MAG TPA: acetate--CoA ligase family protein [Candidatus Tectomicrobia bacterium]
MAAQHPEIHAIDLNPVFAYPTGLLAVDARMLLAHSSAGSDEPATAAFVAR